VVVIFVYFRKAKPHRIILSDNVTSDSEPPVETIQMKSTVIIVASELGDEVGNETILDDLMAGVCPEDLNNSTLNFNTSVMYVDTPVKQLDHPIGASTPNTDTKASTKRCLLPSPVKCVTSDSNFISMSAVHKVNKVLGPDFKGFQSSSSVLAYPKLENLTIYPTETFYGLPQEVFKCLEEFRGIKKLYGQCCLGIMCFYY